MTIVLLQQGSPEWLVFRRDRVGASDSPNLMGFGYKTPYELYQEKKGLTEVFVSNAMRRGTEMEAEARDWYQRETGNIVMPCVMTYPENDLIMASFDGMNFEQDISLEVKCPGINTLNDIQRNGLPESYICQCQHQMFVASLDSVDLVVFDGVRGKIYKIDRDESYILKMLDKILAFLECLKTNTPPDHLVSDYHHRDDHEWIFEANYYRNLIDQIQRLDLAVETSREKLIAMAGERNTKGYGLSLCQYERKGSVDYASIPELKGLDLDQYRKPSSKSYRITLDDK